MPAAAARDRLSKLLAPIDSIFENDLKPRLDGLLTRKQRELGQPERMPRKTSRP